MSEAAFKIFENAKLDPKLYNHGFDTWNKITHSKYNAAVKKLFEAVFKQEGKINEDTAKDIIKWITTGQDVPDYIKEALGDDWDGVIRKWVGGFYDSIA